MIVQVLLLQCASALVNFKVVNITAVVEKPSVAEKFSDY
jgi:hypothetical protein